MQGRLGFSSKHFQKNAKGSGLGVYWQRKNKLAAHVRIQGWGCPSPFTKGRARNDPHSALGSRCADPSPALSPNLTPVPGKRAAAPGTASKTQSPSNVPQWAGGPGQ